MPLEEDTRHSDRNREARNRAADQLEPAMRQWAARFFEVDEEDLWRVRDFVKGGMRRQENVKLSAWEIWKMALVAAAGAVLAWIGAHVTIGSGK